MNNETPHLCRSINSIKYIKTKENAQELLRFLSLDKVMYVSQFVKHNFIGFKTKSTQIGVVEVWTVKTPYWKFEESLHLYTISPGRDGRVLVKLLDQKPRLFLNHYKATKYILDTITPIIKENRNV